MSQSQEPIQHPLERLPGQSTPPPEHSPPSSVVVVQLPSVQPILTYVLLAINIIVFVLDSLLGHTLLAWGAKSNELIVAGQYWRLITPIFLHANLMHLAVNSYSLYIIGPVIERPFGYGRFLVIYLLSGLAGTIASLALNAAPSIGASGAIFGLVGALIPYLLKNRRTFGHERSQRRLFWALQVIALNLFVGFTSSRIDNWGHLGGLVEGVAVAWLVTPVYILRYDSSGQLKAADQTPPQQVWLGVGSLIWLLVGLTFALVLWRR